MKEQIDIILKSKDLGEITLDIVEKVLDNKISEEVLKKIPIAKCILAMKNIYASYSDSIFIKKAMNVLFELGEVNWKERVELTQELEDKYGSGAEKILLAVDKLETFEKCKVYGRLCRLKAFKKIDTHDFLRLTKIIQDAFLDDLELVNDFKNSGTEIYAEDYVSIIALGLIYPERPQFVQEQKNYENEYEESHNKFDGGKIKLTYGLSATGSTLAKFYADLFVIEK